VLVLSGFTCEEWEKMGNALNFALNTDYGHKNKVPISSKLVKIPEHQVTIKERLSVTRPLDQCYRVYQRKAELGNGITGNVCRIVDSYGKERALKANVRPVKKNDTQLIELRNELELLRYLDHPSITRLIESFEDAKSINMVIGMCHGGDLTTKSGKSRLNSESSISIVLYQIIRAVKYLHDRGIAHRDIKVENIMFVSSDPASLRVQLIDFGLASMGKPVGTGSVRRFTTFCGTIPYMSPEVLKAKYDVQTDLWSLGVLSYELLTGKLPFQGATEQAIMKQIRNGRIDYSSPMWKVVSPQAMELVKNLLIFSPCKRWSAALALKCDWLEAARKTIEKSGLDGGQKEPKIVKSIRKFAQYSKLRRTVYNIIAHYFPPEVDQTYQAFLSLDDAHLGKISIFEFCFLMEKQGVPTEEARRAFHILDEDHIGGVTWASFMAATLEMNAVVDNEAMMKAFDYFSHRQGFITSEQLKVVLGSDESEANEILKKLDSDGDGKISRNDFQRALQQENNNNSGSEHMTLT